ncbi:MAG: hypothetical protein K1X55_05855 [Chitinophagales bacterium]|nr:hypothetical protein [Chitinophagales bacterium]
MRMVARRNTNIAGRILFTVHGDLGIWRCGDVEMWRCGDVEMWRCENEKMYGSRRFRDVRMDLEM